MNPRDGGIGPMMNHPFVVEHGHRHADHSFSWLVMFLVLALVVALIVWVVLQVTSRRGGTQLAMQPAMVGPPVDGALEVVRMRYAEGKIERDEFLRVAGDLGAPVEPSPAPSAPPEPSAPSE